MEVVNVIVLKIQPYSDTQKIIHTFSREKGYLSFISPSSVFRRRNATVNCMQVAEVEYFPNPKSELHKLRAITPVINNSAIYFDIYKMNIILLWSEVLNLLLRREQKNEDLFDFIQRSVEYLNTASGDVANFNLFFLYQLLTLIGFRINVDTYAEGYVFNINDGNFCPPGSANPYISGPNAARAICQLCCCKVDDLKDIPLNRKSRSILLDIILLYFSIHLNTDFNIKSIRVLREVFGE